MPVDQSTPLLFEECLFSTRWNKQIHNIKEYKMLLKNCIGISDNIFDWIDRRFKNKNIGINRKIEYLLNSIENTNKAKNSLDFLENILRRMVFVYTNKNKIELASLINSLDRKDSYRNLLKDNNISSDPKQTITELHIINLTLPELYKFIGDNWKCEEDKTKGFVRYFWQKKECRDLKLFKYEMKKIKEYRNIIAHSKRLIDNQEIKTINKIVNRWTLNYRNEILIYS